MVVIDTHVFLWYLRGDSRLPEALRDRMASEPAAVYVPSICFWECMMLAERGRMSLLGGAPDAALKRFLKTSGFSEAPLTKEIAMLSRSLAFEHSDPADRFIAATAKFLEFPLATSDQHLRRLSWLSLAY